MFIHVVNPISRRQTRMEARTLSKVFHLAGFHGWRPERLNSGPPVASWDTAIVMPYVAPYLSGSVSLTDAASLVVSLRRVMTSEGSGLPSELYLAVLGLIAIAEGGGFELRPELGWLDEDLTLVAGGGNGDAPLANGEHAFARDSVDKRKP